MMMSDAGCHVAVGQIRVATSLIEMTAALGRVHLNLYCCAFGDVRAAVLCHGARCTFEAVSSTARLERVA
ncbi:hypothetical protein ASE00_10190 [Sphingomonas sp. Root710]|uniref:hypothetical protein n=1 Tax=Sphingomonas sp. Root710 TaxID=1736594 RepID=UPI0006F47BEC|nr:hypothetical protein [Sphingomonas sp. Root710]KRB82425.1 hypothetical protein ASE00_10190 [Sphingomonas sp. Root710]